MNILAAMAGAAVMALAPAGALAQEESGRERYEAREPFDEEEPYEAPEGSWVSISGTVLSSEMERFELDYGDGVVTVEMDDFDNWPEASVLMAGQDVTVYGLVDADFMENTTIEANSVYVDGLNAYFHASAADEEAAFGAPYYYAPTAPGEITIRGAVTEVRPEEDEFTLDTGFVEADIKTQELLYDPFKGGAFRKIEVGDRTSVTGEVTADWFDERELTAEAIVTLHGGR